MKRRALILAAGASLLARPSSLLAQTQRRYRIGFLLGNNEAAGKPLVDAFAAQLQQLGYVAGRDLVIDVRYGGGEFARFAALADELIALKPDVLVGIEWTARALRARTTSIPIVLSASTDPVAAGLVKSLARPGTNVTGIAMRIDQLIAKQIELLSEIVPKMSRVALFLGDSPEDDPGAPIGARWEAFAKAAAAARGLGLIVARAGYDSAGIRKAFLEIERRKAHGVVITPVATWEQFLDEITGQVRRLRLPSIGTNASWTQAGGLASYGPGGGPRAARFVDRILKGANPAELPLEQPEVFQLVINLKAAQAIGVTIPQSVLLRATRVIE